MISLLNKNIIKDHLKYKIGFGIAAHISCDLFRCETNKIANFALSIKCEDSGGSSDEISFRTIWDRRYP